MRTGRPRPFELVSTDHGTMILNRNDYKLVNDHKGYGVGFQLVNFGNFDPAEVELTTRLLQSRLAHTGPGVIALDCGANVGVFTLEWAKVLAQVGRVYSFEAQEKLFYALAGNVILNNHFNVRVANVALGKESGTITFPEPNYFCPGSFGSFELKKRDKTEDIGQPVDYTHPTAKVPLVTIDSLGFNRVDLMKIDVEGMELDVLDGAAETIQRCKPLLYIEIYKSDKDAMWEKLKAWGYDRHYQLELNVLFMHKDDPLQIQTEEAPKVEADVH